MEKNLIRAIETDYIRPSRTIETILISKEKKEKVVYVYNYEGVHFRLFSDILELIKFFNNENSEFQCFENDNDLDNFLFNVNIE